MSPPRNIYTKATLKFLPEDVTTDGNNFRLKVSDLSLTLIITRFGQPEAIRVSIESNCGVEKYVGCRLVNKYPSKSIVVDFTGVIPHAFCWPDLITLPSVMDSNEGWLDCDGNLTLDITVSEPVNHCKVRSQSELVDKVFRHAKKVNNITVCSGDGKEYKMNDFIFAGHSELLATHLRNKSNGKVVFKSVPSNIMDQFIYFLNCGLINETAESVAFDLAELAHMYDLRRLFDLLEPILVKKVASGQLTRVIRIAKLFRSKALFKAIGKLEEVSEEHLSNESDKFTVEVHGESLSINKALLALKYSHLDLRKDALITALQGASLQVAKGFIGYVKTSKLDDLSDRLFEYASLAQALDFPDLSRLVEQELIANTSKYDRSKVEDLAEAMKSVKICRALATLP